MVEYLASVNDGKQYRSGYQDQRKWPLERESQALQTRQWPGSRRILYLAALRSIHLEGSAFGTYYHRLVERGLEKGSHPVGSE